MIRLKSQTEAVIDVLACRCSEPAPAESVQRAAQTEPAPDETLGRSVAEIRTEARRRQRELYAQRKQQAAECFEQYGQTIPLMSATIRAACLAGDDRGAFGMAAAMLDAVVRTRYTAMVGARYGKHSLTTCIAKLAGSQHISEQTAVALIDAAQIVAKVQAAEEKPKLYGEHAAYIASVVGMFADGVDPVFNRARRRWAVQSNQAAAVATAAYRAEVTQ